MSKRNPVNVVFARLSQIQVVASGRLLGDHCKLQD